MTSRFRLAGAIPLLVMAAPVYQAHAAEVPDSTGSLARDRFVEGFVYATKVGVELGSDGANHYQELRRATAQRDAAQTDLSLAMAEYDRRIAAAGLDYTVYRGASAITKGALSLGGPVGIASAGLLSITLDAVIENAYKEQNQATLTVLKSGLMRMNNSQFNRFKEQLQDGQDTADFNRYVGELLDQGSSATDTQTRRALLDQTRRLALNLSTEALRQQYQAARQISGVATSVDKLKTDLKAAVVKIDDIQAGLSELDENLDRVSGEVGQIRVEMELDRYSRLESAEAKATFLRNGGFSHINVEKRSELLRDLDAKATREAVSVQLQNTEITLGAIASFAGNVLGDANAAKVISDVNKGVAMARLAYTAFGYFTGDTSGIGAIQALGSLSGMFGKSSDPMGGIRSDLAAIKRTLQEMNRKLDTILENQHKMMDAIAKNGERIQGLHLKVDNLHTGMVQGFATVLNAQYANAYAGCTNTITSLTPGGGNITFPFENVQTYTNYHFVNPLRLDILRRDQARLCFQGLQQLALHSDALDAIAAGLKDDGGSKYKEREKAYQELRTAFIGRLGTLGQPVPSATVEHALLVASQSLPTTHDMRIAYASTLTAQAEDDKRTCSWRETSNPAKCWWSSPQSDRNYSKRLAADRFLDPRQVLTVADYVLSLYPQTLVNDLSGPSSGLSAVALAGHIDQSRKGAAGSAARQLLENTLRLVDIAAAHEALMDGNGIAYLLANELITPRISSSSNATPAERQAGILSKSCADKWERNPAGLAASANALLYSHPRVARTTLQIVLQSLLYPDPLKMHISATVVRYELLRGEGVGGAFQQQLHKIPVVRGVRSGRDSSVGAWWRDVLPTGPETSTSTQHATALEMNLPTGATLHAKANRGFEIHYAAIDGMPAKLWRVKQDAGPQSCDGYVLEEVDVALPKGWSISAGGLAMSLPPAVDVQAGRINQSNLLRALEDRRAALRSELASLVVDAPRSIKSPYEYALGRQAASVITGSPAP